MRTLVLPRLTSLSALIAASLCSACAGDASAPDAAVFGDVGGRVDAGVDPDGGSAADASGGDDGGAPDAAAADGATADAGTSTGAVTVTRGGRCAPERRRGAISVTDWGGPTRAIAWTVFDRPEPWVGAPASTTEVCRFHRAYRGGCMCSGARVCDHGGACVDLPTPAPAVTIVARGARGTERFTGDGSGQAGGELTLPDAEVALRLEAPGLAVDLPALRVPEALDGLTGVLDGTYDAPTKVTLTWTRGAPDTYVHSLTRINHHVPEITFTDCRVPVSVGRLEIEEAMLRPLAVSTGLEFQALELVDGAVIDTPAGCLDVRFARMQFVNLQPR